MRRRPQPNRRRGLLRATAAVIGLIILLVIVVAVVSSLTAPTAKAPTVPPTVGPITATPATGTTTPGTRTPATRTVPKPSPSATTTGKHKHVSLGLLTLDDRSGTGAYAALIHQTTSRVSPAVPDARDPYFIRAGSAYRSAHRVHADVEPRHHADGPGE